MTAYSLFPRPDPLKNAHSYSLGMKSMRKHTSFTLVEMLVGAAVFSILILLLFTILSMASQLWLAQTGKEDSFRETRAALNMMSRDLNAAITATNQDWYYSNTNSAPNATNQLAFLTTLPDASQPSGVDKGDICAVGYSLEYTTNDASSTELNMSLYRYVGFSDWTYNNIVNTNGPTGAQSVSVIFTSVDNVNVVKSLIARDVYQFNFTGYTTNSTGALVPPTDAGLPAIMDISLAAVNEQVAKHLTSQQAWQSSNTMIEANQETFNLRVRTISP